MAALGKLFNSGPLGRYLDGLRLPFPRYLGIDQYHRAIASLPRICSYRSLVDASARFGYTRQAVCAKENAAWPPIKCSTPQEFTLLVQGHAWQHQCCHRRSNLTVQHRRRRECGLGRRKAMPEAIDRNRRRFLATAAIALATAKLGIVGCANAQSGPDIRLPEEGPKEMARVRAQIYRRVEDCRRAARPVAAAGESGEGHAALWCARRGAQRGRRSRGDTALTNTFASVGMAPRPRPTKPIPKHN